MPQKLRVIITGATGMVGEGVLHECLLHTDVESVLSVSRKRCNITHPKLKEIIHENFFDLSLIKDQFQNYNTCFFCLGVSSVGMKEQAYYGLTYTLTMHMAETLAAQNKEMTFCYISGAGTDSTESGKIMWARVKGKTENDLLKLAFKQVYNFRPGVLQPTKALQNALPLYKYVGWLLPLVKSLAPNYVSSLKELGLAMIHAAAKGYKKAVLEVPDINALAKLA